MSVRAMPRSKRAGLDGIHNGALRVRVTAAPVDGAANDAVIEVLASTLGLPRSAFEIVKGNRSRAKIVSIHGLTADELEVRVSRVSP